MLTDSIRYLLYGMTAVASISTFALSSNKLLTSTTDIAGKWRPNTSLYFCPNVFKEDKYSCLSVINQVILVTCIAFALAASNILTMLRNACADCSEKSSV